MRKLLNITDWNRKAIFEHFINLDEPFFGVTVHIDCTIAYEYCKANGLSFFMHYLHKATIAANELTPFGYRIIDNKVYTYDIVHASATISRLDNTFGFAHFPYYADFETFRKEAEKEMERIQHNQDLMPETIAENIMHFSALPWLDFTSLSHARNYKTPDSCPKVSFGKVTTINNKKNMPVAIHVHHALMDGYHIGQYVALFQKLMNQVHVLKPLE